MNVPKNKIEVPVHDRNGVNVDFGVHTKTRTIIKVKNAIQSWPLKRSVNLSFERCKSEVTARFHSPIPCGFEEKKDLRPFLVCEFNFFLLPQT